MFSYIPDIDFDPHTSDFSEGEDDVAELGGDKGISSATFDNYEIDEVDHSSSHYQHNGNPPSLTIPPKHTWSCSSSSTDSPVPPPIIHSEMVSNTIKFTLFNPTQDVI